MRGKGIVSRREHQVAAKTVPALDVSLVKLCNRHGSARRTLTNEVGEAHFLKRCAIDIIDNFDMGVGDGGLKASQIDGKPFRFSRLVIVITVNKPKRLLKQCGLPGVLLSKSSEYR